MCAACAPCPLHSLNAPGYRYRKTAGTPSAVPCGINSYSPGLARQVACTPCPAGFVTDPDLPPGVQTVPGVCGAPPGSYIADGESAQGYACATSCCVCAASAARVQRWKHELQHPPPTRTAEHCLLILLLLFRQASSSPARRAASQTATTTPHRARAARACTLVTLAQASARQALAPRHRLTARVSGTCCPGPRHACNPVHLPLQTCTPTALLPGVEPGFVLVNEKQRPILNTLSSTDVVTGARLCPMFYVWCVHARSVHECMR